jgi:Holliday junction DNA helicase RuvA
VDYGSIPVFGVPDVSEQSRGAYLAIQPCPGGLAMIASVEGVVGAVAADSLVIEVGGIGYRVFASPAVIAGAQPGGRLKLHTFHLVREDVQALYGFRTVEELGFFNLLLTVTGVGPKVALAIVGSRPTPDLQLAIMAQDQAVLVSIPGIGKKLAERVIFELKEKVAAAGVAVGGSAAAGAAAGEGEIVAALQALGYSLAEAREASRTALAAVGVASTLEERVKAALRSLLRS